MAPVNAKGPPLPAPPAVVEVVELSETVTVRLAVARGDPPGAETTMVWAPAAASEGIVTVAW